MPATRSCPACGGPLMPWRMVPASDPALAPAEYQLSRCSRCATAVTDGAGPDTSDALHQTGAYRPGTPRLHRLARPVLAAFDRQRLALVRTVASPGARLLDAGAGKGRFVVAAAEAGYDAWGLEPAPRSGQTAGAWSSRIQRVGIEEAQVEASSLDVITLWHVLEHVQDPRPALRRIADWLRPGGGLLVGVPNLDSLQARLGGPRWYHLDVPRHRTHFTAKGLCRLLSSEGFSVRHTHHVLLEHNAFGMWQSLVSRFTSHPSYVYNVLKRNAPLRSPDLAISLVGLPLAPLAAGLELLAGLGGHGGTVAVLATRD
ncbi:MAG: class I SAM-dependent methyltransferase [Solirubrobacteraceae bacterium]